MSKQSCKGLLVTKVHRSNSQVGFLIVKFCQQENSFAIEKLNFAVTVSKK